MLNILKKHISLIICAVLVLSFAGCFAGCSSAEMTEENITSTVAEVEQALRDFDRKKLKKHVSSTTLTYILKYAENKEQFAELGKSIFENLTMTVESVDAAAGTVTVKVSNKDMQKVAGDFAEELTSSYNTLELLKKLNDDSFLDESLSSLRQDIAAVTDTRETTVTLNVAKGKRCLVIGFDDAGEDAVSGGALLAIKSIVG